MNSTEQYHQKGRIDPEGYRAWAMLFLKYGNETNRDPEVEASSDR